MQAAGSRSAAAAPQAAPKSCQSRGGVDRLGRRGGGKTGHGAGAVDRLGTAPARPEPRGEHLELYRDLIAAALARGRNAMAIWQDLVDGHGFPAGYASVMRFVRHLRGAAVPEAHAIIQTAPGEEGQVDGRLRHRAHGPPPVTQKYRRTRLSVLTLALAASVRLLTFHSSARLWAELHERAFHRLGGAPAIAMCRRCGGLVTA